MRSIIPDSISAARIEALPGYQVLLPGYETILRGLTGLAARVEALLPGHQFTLLGLLFLLSGYLDPAA
jgi:hypothetical protein